MCNLVRGLGVLFFYWIFKGKARFGGSRKNWIEISFENKSLNLTEKESDLILFINSYKRADLKKIQKTVWGHSNDLETHTVETHIYRLRKKMIKAFEDHSFIKHDQDGYFIN